jgi:hypothetical protein
MPTLSDLVVIMLCGVIGGGIFGNLVVYGVISNAAGIACCILASLCISVYMGWINITWK